MCPCLPLITSASRLFTVPYFFVRSFRYTASYRHGYLDFQMYRAGGRRGWQLLGGGGEGRENRPRPLSSFDTHARWQPVTQSARSRWSYGKIEDCEQSNLQANSLFSMHNNWPLYLLKPYGSFILKLFLPLTFTVFVRIQNTFRIKVVQVICIMFRDKWIILHLHEMVQFKKHQETSRKLKIYKGMVFETR